jgi:hypothetical protein
MSNDQRFDSAFRPSIYQASAEPMRQRAKDSTVVTGLEKPTALSNTEPVQGRAGDPRDRNVFAIQSDTDSAAQNQPLSFADLVDVINPLQHIPLVSSVYRAVTSDEISVPARIAGSSLFFGPLGFASTVANLVVADITGQDIGGHIASLLTGGAPDPDTVNSPSSTETAAAEVSAQSELSGFFNTALLSSSASGALPASKALSPDQPFAFNTATPSAILEAPRASGFAGSPEPVALGSMPDDILAALYSGQPTPAAGPDLGGKNATKADAARGSTAQLDATNYARLVDAAPRWGLSPSPDDALATAPLVALSYGGVTPEDMSAAGGVATQGGWFGASMSEVLARYQDGANLQRQATMPFVDVSQ